MSITTGMGPSQVRRLVGQRVSVTSHRAPLSVTALYATTAQLTSGGSQRCHVAPPPPCTARVTRGQGRCRVMSLLGSRQCITRLPLCVIVWMWLLGGGPLSVATMDCSEGAQLCSGGGPVAVGCLEGNAEVRSEGGAVEVSPAGAEPGTGPGWRSG